MNTAVLRFLFILLTAASAAASSMYYSKKNFPGSGTARYVLIVLRTAVLSAVLFLLFFRVISVNATRTDKPLVAVLVDASESADAAVPAVSSVLYADSLVQTVRFRSLLRSSSVLFGTFGGDAVFLNDAPAVLPSSLAKSTNIANALEKAGGKFHPDACIMITDGNYNRGPNPVHAAGNLGCPVHVIAAGADSMAADIEVADMRANEITFTGSALSIETDISARGYTGEKVPMYLRAGGRIVDSKTVELPPSDQLTTVTLEWTPPKPGSFPVSIEIPPSATERYKDNNRRDMTITVLKNKIRVLMVAGFPDPDTGALYRALSRDSNAEVTLRVLSKQGSMYRGGTGTDTADEYDVLICKDLFSDKVFSVHSRYISDLAGNFTGNMMVVQHSSPADNFSQLFSVTLSGSSARSVTVSMTDAGRHHPVFTDLDIGMTKELSPVTLVHRAVDFSVPAATVLQAAPVEGRDNMSPVVSASSIMNRKRLFIWGSGLYAWALNRESRPWFDGFVANSVRWLSLRETGSGRRVIIRTNRKNFESGQRISVSAQIYGELYTLLKGGSVEVQVLKKGEEYARFVCDHKDNSMFFGTTVLHEPGIYTLIARGNAEGAYAGSDTATVYVSAFNPEYHNTGANMAVLRAVAKATGGQIASADESLDSFLEGVAVRPVSRKVTVITDLLTVPYILAGIVLLAAAEWILRKRTGLL